MRPWLLPVQSQRLRLVPAQAEHAEAYADAAVESHAEISAWSKRGSGGDRASYVKQAIARAAPTADGTFVRRYAFSRELPELLIGSVGIQAWQKPVVGERQTPPETRVDQSPDLELGCWCRTSLVGQGYACEAMTATIEHAFRDLDAQAIWVRMGAENTRSRRLAERLGFGEVERIAFPASPEWGDAATVLIMRRHR